LQKAIGYDACVLSDRGRMLAAGYLMLQAAAVSLWWVVLWRVPAARALFLPPGNHISALHAFAGSDLLLLALGSAFASLLIARRNPWALPLVSLVAGAFGYATIYVVGWAWLANGAWLGVVLMAPAALLSALRSCAIVRECAAGCHVSRRIATRKDRLSEAGYVEDAIDRSSQFLAFRIKLQRAPRLRMRVSARVEVAPGIRVPQKSRALPS
jgi:hypothetical protein